MATRSSGVMAKASCRAASSNRDVTRTRTLARRVRCSSVIESEEEDIGKMISIIHYPTSPSTNAREEQSLAFRVDPCVQELATSLTSG